MGNYIPNYTNRMITKIKKSGIYIIKNWINGKVYVGSTLNFLNLGQKKVS